MGQIIPIPEEIKEFLKYEPNTGEVCWIRKPSRKTQIGDRVTYVSNKGYYGVKFKKINYLLHRVIWLLQTGNQPPETIDHIDGNTCNNTWKNLREATKQQNCRNARKYKNNTSGYKGVSWNKSSKSWLSQAKLNGKSTHLGYYNTPELAYEAYCAFITEHHKEFVNYG